MRSTNKNGNPPGMISRKITGIEVTFSLELPITHSLACSLCLWKNKHKNMRIQNEESQNKHGWSKFRKKHRFHISCMPVTGQNKYGNAFGNQTLPSTFTSVLELLPLSFSMWIGGTASIGSSLLLSRPLTLVEPANVCQHPSFGLAYPLSHIHPSALGLPQKESSLQNPTLSAFMIARGRIVRANKIQTNINFKPCFVATILRSCFPPLFSAQHEMRRCGPKQGVCQIERGAV